MCPTDPADDRASDRVDAHLGLLAAPACRYALYFFGGSSDATATPSELADWAVTTDRVDPDASRDRLAVRFHHAALPRLDRCGAVTYDAADRTAEYRGGADIEALVALASRAEREGW
ncbi:DUF7344 domain-containing protein [Halorussus sp. AFM4]|uniref:DUF7344 domain-containing protein n=1 Tax=Halorussus sp. AFM4 TaxID=3421651 RepID=UPI003EBDC209